MSQCLNPNCLHQNRPGNKFCDRCGSKLLLGDRYRALEIIGRGGFGRTFKACDEYKPSKPSCVIKQFLPQAQGTANEQKAAELFDREAVRLESLGKHPQIPELLAYFSQEGRQYLVQEFIDGENLQQEVKRGAFPEERIRQLLNDLLPVLQFCHDRQVIHRDIKPENIIRRKSDRALVLVDFGAAKLVTRTALSVTGTVVGSQGYMAPEQSRGKATFASDIYSLAVTCIHLMTRVDPFDLFDVDEGEWVWRKYLSKAPSNELGQLLDKMLQPAPKKRYQSAAEVLAALNPVAPPKISPPPPKISRRPIPKSPPLPAPKMPVAPAPPPPPAFIPQVRSNNVPLESAYGIDYRRLRNLLAAGNWKEADQETCFKMLAAMGRAREKYLRKEDFDNFPCEDLRTIDRLWVKYSNGRFGFSVQKRIYEQLGGTNRYNPKVWEAFGDRVGWRKGRKWVSYGDLGFTIATAPPGSLPFGWLRDGKGHVGGWDGEWDGWHVDVNWNVKSLFSNKGLRSVE